MILYKHFLIFERFNEVNLRKLPCFLWFHFLFSLIKISFHLLETSKIHHLPEGLLLPKEGLFVGFDLAPSPITAAASFLWDKAKSAEISVSAGDWRLIWSKGRFNIGRQFMPSFLSKATRQHLSVGQMCVSLLVTHPCLLQDPPNHSFLLNCSSGSRW